jgi:hypothetical protein
MHRSATWKHMPKILGPPNNSCTPHNVEFQAGFLMVVYNVKYEVVFFSIDTPMLWTKIIS